MILCEARRYPTVWKSAFGTLVHVARCMCVCVFVCSVFIIMVILSGFVRRERARVDERIISN